MATRIERLLNSLQEKADFSPNHPQCYSEALVLIRDFWLPYLEANLDKKSIIIGSLIASLKRHGWTDAAGLTDQYLRPKRQIERRTICQPCG